MEKYDEFYEVGHGSYGVVYKARNMKNGEVVAIKKLYRKRYSVDDSLNLLEVKSLFDLNDHRNIVKLKQLFNEQGVVYLAFEYMECSLLDRIRCERKPLLENEIKDICFQVLQGLAYMHHKGYMHRDLKPANLLVSKNNMIKISDFGFACKTASKRPLTHKVTTRAYRAPEVFLQAPVYDSAVDMWAMGALMAEMYTRSPLFLRRSSPSEADIMYEICKVLGTPTKTTWPGGLELARKLEYEFPDFFGLQFSDLLPNASSDAVNLIASLLSWDPSMRPTAMDALQHPFFDQCHIVPRCLRHEPPIVTPSLIRAPYLFALAREREKLKIETCLKRSEFSKRFERFGDHEMACLLPKYLFDYEIEEEIKKETCLKRFDGVEDYVIRLPEYLYDFEIEQTSMHSCVTDMEEMHDAEDLLYEFVDEEEPKRTSMTEGFLWRGLSKAWAAIKYKCLMQQ